LVLPRPARTIPAFQIVRQLFARPETFLQVELTGLTAAVLAGCRRDLDINVYLNQDIRELPPVSKDTFRPSCAPVVNLYTGTSAEAIDSDEPDQPLVFGPAPDNRPHVYAVNQVKVLSADGAATEYLPCYTTRYREAGRTSGRWHTSRRGRRPGDSDYTRLTLHAADGVAAGTLMVTALLCDEVPVDSNTRPLQLRWAGGELAVEPIGLTPPSATFHPDGGGTDLWDLVAGVCRAQIGVSGMEADAALAELFRLCGPSSAVKDCTQGLRKVQSRRGVTALVDHGVLTHARGTDIELHVDPSRLPWFFFLGGVLEQFLARYATWDSCTRPSPPTAPGA
jgi:type VI protein secretion system component VasA